MDAKKELNELEPGGIQEVLQALFDKDVSQITLDKSVEARASQGGTATEQVRHSIDEAREEP